MWYFPVNVCCLSYFHCAGMLSPPHPFWCEDEVCGGDSAPSIPSPTYSVGEGADGNYLTMPLARCYVVQCCAMITSRNLLPASVRMYVRTSACPRMVVLSPCGDTVELYFHSQPIHVWIWVNFCLLLSTWSRLFNWQCCKECLCQCTVWLGPYWNSVSSHQLRMDCGPSILCCCLCYSGDVHAYVHV